jgi:hypothetical protein
MALQLHTVVFVNVLEEGPVRSYSYAHPYAFVSREAAERFANFCYAQNCADNVEILPRDSESNVSYSWTASTEDLPF